METASIVIISGTTFVESSPEFASYGVLRKVPLVIDAGTVKAY